MSRVRNHTGALASVVIAVTFAWVAAGQHSPAEPTAAPAATAPPGEQEIPFVSPYAAAVEVPSAPGAWGGPRTGKEPTLSDRVVKYEIKARLEPKTHVIDGDERLTWRNRSDRVVKSVYLHLYLNAFEGPGSTFFTEARANGLTFRSNVGMAEGEWGHIALKKVEQGGVSVPWRFVHPDNGPETDHTVVRLDLPAAVGPGESAVLDIAFQDQLPRVVARTGYFGSFHMVAQWFPKIGVLELPGERGAVTPRWNVHEFHTHSEFYADWGEYDVRLTVPKGFQIASAGEEQGAPAEEGENVTRRFVQGDIHDFAWMAVDNFAPPLEGGYDGAGSPHVKVRVFYPPEYEASAAPALQATIDSLRWFSETLGPYPYRTSTCIVPPFNAMEAGGMEYQTIFTAAGFSTVEPETLAAAALDFVTIHEFGHGYFYGLLASNEFEEPMLDEGLNDYWDFRMMRARGQPLHLTTPFLKRLGIAPVLEGFVAERARGSLQRHTADPIGQNAWNRLSSESYGQVYSRTATMMHDLEERLGRDVIERAFRSYYAKWHFRHPSTADLREALVEASSDRDTVERAFHNHVYGTADIDDRIESLTSEEDLPRPGTVYRDGLWVEQSEQAVKNEIEKTRAEWKSAHSDAKYGGPFAYRTTVTVRHDGASVPGKLVVRFEDGSSESASWNDAPSASPQPPPRWRRFTFIKPVKAKSAELDPERRIYLDYDKLNDGRAVLPDRSASRRWAGDLSAIVEVLYALWGSL